MRGKRHGIEHAAGACILVGMALLIGHRVLSGVDKVLCGTNDANHGEKADGNDKHSLSLMAVNKHAVDAGSNGLGKIIGAATALAAIRLDLADTGIQNDGIHHLDHGGRYILGAATGLGHRAEIGRVGVTLEHADIVLAAVKNHVLFHNGDTVEFLRSSGAYARLKGQLDIETDGHGIKTAVETDGIDPHKRPSDTRILDTNGRSMFYDLIPDVGQENANILKAISVAARIQNAIGLDADHIAITGARRRRRVARKSVFGHKISILQYSI